MRVMVKTDAYYAIRRPDGKGPRSHAHTVLEAVEQHESITGSRIYSGLGEDITEQVLKKHRR